MRTHRILTLAFAAFLMIPALASAATPPAQVQTAASPVAASPAVPSLDGFLASLDSSAPAPVFLATNSCGSNFCTQAQRDACTQQCLSHHAGTFVGLECCTSSCTTLCICGSRPVAC